MSLLGTQIKSFEDLFEKQLKDLYDAELRLTEALPKMAQAANAGALKEAFLNHLAETRQQVQRLEQIFHTRGIKPERTTCQAMKGLIAEGDEIAGADADADLKDAGIIAAAQRVEHYEMAGYGTARTFAERLGHIEAAQLLQITLNEEAKADKKLTEVAEQSVNLRAQTK